MLASFVRHTPLLPHYYYHVLNYHETSEKSTESRLSPENIGCIREFDTRLYYEYNLLITYFEVGNMNQDLAKAQAVLADYNYTCVLCRDDRIYTSDRRGIAPLLGWLDSGVDPTQS